MTDTTNLRAVQRAKQIARIAIPHIDFIPCRRFKRSHSVLRNTTRAIAAADEPDSIKGGVIGKVHKRRNTRIVRPGEMPILGKALVMEDEIGRRKVVRCERSNARRILTRKRRRRRANTYSHKLPVSSNFVIFAQARG